MQCGTIILDATTPFCLKMRVKTVDIERNDLCLQVEAMPHRAEDVRIRLAEHVLESPKTKVSRYGINIQQFRK